MNKIAVFPGSFDPFTNGHNSIVRRALPLFDKIVIAVGINQEKKYYFPLEKRMKWIQDVFAGEPKITVDKYSCLTVQYCRRIGAKFLLRGLRTAMDFEYERMIAQNNKVLAPDIESVFILTTPEMTAVNSSTIRDILRHGGDASHFVPKEVDLKV
ncbi:MAG: pantetheine-phosphate adenylyltransferase [Bacteroidetes bacterium]|nr:pantetheine-phosphate adenylyltransferase [Bacteroidota bacterium]